MEESGNKRIAKNAAILYVRMLVMMFISFFTARVILNALGVDDYGIYNVVGGLVSMFSVLLGSLSSATSRFLTFGLGKGDLSNLKKIFSTTINIHIILAIIVVLIIESVGVWFLNHRMTIPIDRMYAANWVLQCSVIVFATGLLSVPYNAAIIAHEKMSAFAYMTIFDVTSKLLIAFGVYYYHGDKLILLSILFVCQCIINRTVYWLYCKRKFTECSYSWGWDKHMSLRIFSFAGWNFIGSTADLMKDQGVNIVINIFTGPVVNAARGIAMQINSAVNQFTNNFMVAIKPQITKCYAVGELQRMQNLIFQGTRLSFFLFMLISIPLFLEIEKVLYLWLGQVPKHTVLFARLILILSLSEILSNALITAQLATGEIKKYQLTVGGILLLNLPLSYLLLKIGIFPESTIVVAIILSQLCLLVRLKFLRDSIKLSIRLFLRKVYWNVLLTTIVAIIPPAICFFLISDSTLRFFIVCFGSVITSFLSIYYLGCNQDERILLKMYCLKFKNKYFN